MNEKSKNPQSIDELLAQLPADTPERRLLEALIPDKEFTHEEAQAILPDYVTDELLGRPVRDLYPQLHRHLLHCQQCTAMYAAMMADVTEEAPQTVGLPQPDLSFLSLQPNSRLNEILDDVRSATQEALQAIIVSTWPQLQNEVKVVVRVFFRQLDQFGEDFILQPNAARALGFGSEKVPLSQRLAATVYKSNVIIKEKYGTIEKPSEAVWSQEVRQIAENAAWSMGLTDAEKERFVSSYLTWLTENDDN
jgi:hypothetical protein